MCQTFPYEIKEDSVCESSGLKIMRFWAWGAGLGASGSRGLSFFGSRVYKCHSWFRGF